jgi:hypothetical protein
MLDFILERQLYHMLRESTITISISYVMMYYLAVIESFILDMHVIGVRYLGAFTCEVKSEDPDRSTQFLQLSRTLCTILE